jgi:hypothetical protein
VVDIDRDGDTEIFAGRLDMFVYAWDTQGLFDSLHTWQMFKGNAARTGGQLRSPFAVSAREDPLTPMDFNLLPAYPNPFNPSVRWTLRVSESAEVRAVVYDVLGREVRTLKEGVLSPGTHALEFDAAGLAGGVYYCRVLAQPLSGRARFTGMQRAVLVR